MKIAAVDTGLYRIQLPVALSDSTHGTITHFELITVRLRDADGAEGVGYTYTVGAGGAAVHALIDTALRPALVGAEGEEIEALWQRMWWRLHYGGRGGLGPLSSEAARRITLASSAWARCRPRAMRAKMTARSAVPKLVLAKMGSEATRWRTVAASSRP